VEVLRIAYRDGADIRASIGKPRQVGARFSFVQAAVLAAKSLLVGRRRAKPGLPAGARQHRYIPQTRVQPGTDPVKQFARGPYLGTAVKPFRELVEDRGDVVGMHVQEDIA
jgi:hypothetical protein